MALATILSIAPPAMWAFALGALLGSPRRTRPARWRLVATILISIWLTFCAASLWRNPAIEPLWLQYSLLVALPGAVGFGFASIAKRLRANRSALPTADTPSAPEETADGGIR